MKCLRNANGIKVGDKFRYKSKGYHADNAMISVNAEYDAEVIQVTEYLIVLRMTVDQKTIHRLCIWEPTPYNWSIRKVDVGRTEKLYLTED